MAIQADYSTPAAALGRRAHSDCETCEALSLAAFLVDKVLGATALIRRRFVGRPSIYAWRVVVSMHILKES